MSNQKEFRHAPKSSSFFYIAISIYEISNTCCHAASQTVDAKNDAMAFWPSRVIQCNSANAVCFAIQGSDRCSTVNSAERQGANLGENQEMKRNRQNIMKQPYYIYQFKSRLHSNRDDPISNYLVLPGQKSTTLVYPPGVFTRTTLLPVLSYRSIMVVQLKVPETLRTLQSTSVLRTYPIMPRAQSFGKQM